VLFRSEAGAELTVPGLGAGRLAFDDTSGTRLVPLAFGTEKTSDNEQYYRLYRKDIDNLSDSRNADAPYLQSVLEQGEGFAWQTDEAGEEYLALSFEMGKMSKRKYNVVNPDDVVDYYGADCFRMYEMFLGPVEQGKPWNTSGIDGVFRFLRKFWALFHDAQDNWAVSDAEPAKEELKILHTAIKKVTEDIERFSLNTCVSAFMVATNDLGKLKCNKRAILEPLVRLIAPYAVHIAEELWHQLGNETSVHHTDWPKLEEQYLAEDSVTYPIAVNGRTRLTVDFPVDADKAALEQEVLAMEDVQKYIEGQQVRRVIVVPGRMINLVVG
jgi:leucyl-tRNA synthetase